MADQQEACILLANGNKLCGADAVSYCRGFVRGDADPSSRAVCASVIKTEEGPEPITDPSPGDNDNDHVPNYQDLDPDDARVKRGERITITLDNSGTSLTATEDQMTVAGRVDRPGAMVFYVRGGELSRAVKADADGRFSLPVGGFKVWTNRFKLVAIERPVATGSMKFSIFRR